MTSARGSADRRKSFEYAVPAHRKYCQGVSVTQVEASRHFQIWTLSKVIHSGDAELVASFFCEIADGDLCGRDGFSSIAPLPGLIANLPPLHNVALDGHGTVAVRRGPLDGDGELGLVVYHSIDWGIRRMLPCRCGAKIECDALYMRNLTQISLWRMFSDDCREDVTDMFIHTTFRHELLEPRLNRMNAGLLTGDGESGGSLAVTSHEGNFSRVICLAVSDGERVLPEQASDGYPGIFPQLLAVAGPVGIHAGMLQLHAEDDRVTDRNHRPPGKLLCNVACDAKGF